MKHLVAIALSASVALFSGIFSARPLLAQDFAVNVGRELCDDAEVGETPDVSSGSFTVGARVKLLEPGGKRGNGDAVNGMIFAVGNGWNDGFRVYYDWKERRFTFNVGKEENAEYCATSKPVMYGVMRDLVAVCDGQSGKLLLYVDGFPVAEAPHACKINAEGKPLVVGYANSGIGSNRMFVDRVDYWARALTANEVAARSVERTAEEIVQAAAMDKLAELDPKTATLNNIDPETSVKLDLPPEIERVVKRSKRAQLLAADKIPEVEPLVFEEADALIAAAKSEKDSVEKEPTAEQISRYGDAYFELQKVKRRSKVNSKRAEETLKELAAANPRVAAEFEKILKLEQSAERTRLVEKEAIATYAKVARQVDVAVERRIIYVSPQGNDAEGTGERFAPFASLARACQEAAKPTQGKRALTIVELAGGVYRVRETAKLAGVQNLLVRPAKNAKVTLTGGVKVNNFVSAANAAKTSDTVAKNLERFPEAAREHIFVADLSALGVLDFGSLANRGYGLGDKAKPIPSLYFGGESQTLARWPNLGEEPLKFGEKVETDDEQTSTFKYDYDRPDRWQNLDGIWAFGLYEWEWAANLRKVVKIDREKKEVTFDYKGGSGRFTYYFTNVLEELDAPGEYYVDNVAGLVYFYPPEEIASAQKLNAADVEFDEFSERFFELENCANVILRDLNFKLGRESLGLFKDCERCYAVGCTAEQFGGNAIIISKGSYCGSLDSRYREFGGGCFRISAGDRDSLTQARHIVYNNFISDFSRIDRVYAPAVHADGCGVAITNNLICDSPHHAMRTDGNDMYIARNEVHSCVYEYSDQSGIDIYCDPTYRGIVIEKNLWRHIGSAFALCGQAGIRLDDSISGVIMLDNVFYRSSGGFFGGIQIHGGKDNLARGNLFVDCKHAFSFSPWRNDRYLTFVRDQFPEHVGSARYLAAYPFFDELTKHIDRNYILENVAVNCELFSYRGDDLNVYSGNLARTAKPNLEALGVRGQQKTYDEVFYTNTTALRQWLELLSGKTLKDVGLKRNWNGANIDVSPNFIGGAGAQTAEE